MDNWCGNSRRAIDGRRSIHPESLKLAHMSVDNPLFAAAHTRRDRAAVRSRWRRSRSLAGAARALSDNLTELITYMSDDNADAAAKLIAAATTSDKRPAAGTAAGLMRASSPWRGQDQNRVTGG